MPQQSPQGRRLLEVTALSGEYPADELFRLIPSDSYGKKLLTSLKANRQIRIFRKDGLQGFRLTKRARTELLQENPERYQALFSIMDTPQLKSEVGRRLRLHRMAEVYPFLLDTGVPLFPDEKPPVRQALSDPFPAYYSSLEIKNASADSCKIRNSRAAGILTCMGTVFLFYSMGGSLMKWNYRSELRMRSFLQHSLFPAPPSQIQSIVLADGIQLALRILRPENVKGGYLLLDGSIERFHFLSNDEDGRLVLRLLTDPDKAAQLNQILLQDLTPPKDSSAVECDGMDANGRPVLFAYLFDMPRIVRFTQTLELHGQPGTLICFDFQREVLRTYCPPQIQIQSIRSDKIRKGFFP